MISPSLSCPLRSLPELIFHAPQVGGSGTSLLPLSERDRQWSTRAGQGVASGRGDGDLQHPMSDVRWDSGGASLRIDLFDNGHPRNHMTEQGVGTQ
jgi:hypothetical protein